ncbi:AAA family ATPase [Nannocystis sp. SCPEA4]|uniref:AAA family ATPase n=1 Tax=Nannocystis sp. SCPEA4 TaxID=2996787 RepID=UPI0022701C4E|nr:AAA family ATPase [Nannocystis sp. SCPEA4]MCY1055996.1 AAA family ATPase [Nannocystis sp. SCPEA4]
MSIARLELRDFTVFKQAEFEFCPGINVLMGENGTGKSHVLKAMYAALRGAAGETPPGAGCFSKVVTVFRPDAQRPARLVRHGCGGSWSIRLLDGRGDGLHMCCEQHGADSLSVIADMHPAPSLFVPPREVLAMYDGFVAAYEGRELDFDETYRDICKALGAAPLRGARAEAVRGLLEPLEKVLGGKVLLRGNHFYVQRGDCETEAHLLAEGLRKLACLAYLVANGAITRDSVVFWDEPEASLNPRLVVQVVEFVRALTRAGVQVFLASHDFLLLHRLSQPAEHALDPDVPIRFFSLYRPRPAAPVEVETGATLADIEHNAILEEFARYYDDERAYAWREMAEETASATGAKRAGKKIARAATRTRPRPQSGRVRTKKVAKAAKAKKVARKVRTD